MSSISLSKLKNAYLGKAVYISGSSRALSPIELPSKSSVRNQFLKKVIRLQPSLLMQYRSRLLFSGRGRAITIVGSQASMEATVARNVTAIGYISHPPRSKKVKTILKI